MKKEMYEIAVELRDGIISINSPDRGMGEGEVFFTVEQAHLVIKWIQEAVEEAARGNGEADEK